MTQLALLLALSLIGVVLSFAFGRLEVKRGPVSATVKRAEGALERASVAVLRLGAARGLALVGVPALGLAGFALLGGGQGSIPAAGRAAFLVIALLAGAGSALVQARLALGLGTRAASSAAAAVARGSTRAMRPLLRAAAAIAIFGEGWGILGTAAAFASLYAVRGGFAGTGETGALVGGVVQLLPAFALGAAVTSLALSREGSVAATAARVGGGQAAAFDVSGERDDARDARDPALLAELVGHLTGELLPRALTSYVCGLCATVSVALLALGGDGRKGAFSWLVLVLLVRGFGAVGSVCGVFAARATDEEAPARALWRGQACALLVSLFGLGAALFWLQREHWLPLFAAGALGLSTLAVVGQLSWLPLRRGTAAARELSDARSSGEAATIARGASAGLAGLWPALVLPALVLGLLERLLSQSTPSGLLLVTFAAGALSLSPFALSMAGFSLLTTHARGVVALARLEVEARRRGGRLEDAGVLGAAAGSTHVTLALALTLLLGLLSLSGGAAPSPPGSLGFAAFATVAGVVLVLFFAARATRSAVLGARLVTAEVERQLREFPRQQGVPALPMDFTPSYKGCVEAALNAARAASVVELAGLLIAPFLLGALLHWGASPTLSSPLIGFGVAAVLAGLVVSLGGRATRATLSELRRRLRSSDGGLVPRASAEAESFGELVGVTAASSVEALALVLALTVLCLAPLLH